MALHNMGVCSKNLTACFISLLRYCASEGGATSIFAIKYIANHKTPSSNSQQTIVTFNKSSLNNYQD